MWAQKGYYAASRAWKWCLCGPEGLCCCRLGPELAYLGPEELLFCQPGLEMTFWGPERLSHQLSPDLVCLLFRVRGAVDFFLLRSLFIVVQKYLLPGIIIIIFVLQSWNAVNC